MPTPLHEQKDLLQERARIFERMKEVRQKAEADNRDLTAEEQGHWDQGMKDMDSLKQRADRQATEAATEKELNSVVRSIARPEVGDRATASFTSTAEYREAFDHMLRTGSDSKMVEFRAMSVGSPTDGGYLVPDDLLNRVAEYEDAALGVNFLVTEYAASRPFHIARETNRPTVSGVAEVGSYLEVGATTNVITFSPFKLGRIVKVSEELVMDSVVSLDTFLARKLGQGAGIEKSRLFISGTGSSQPEGILTSCTEGSTGGAISATILNSLMFSVPQAFRMNGAWVGHSTALSAIRALSIADNASPYWTLSLQPGEPDRLMGKPIYEDDNMPTHANGNKVLLFGDFATYEVATFMPPTIQRLIELYAGTGQVGFRYTERFDGHPTNVRAIAWHRRTS